MNDHHLDPPDYPDLPECCGDEMECFEDGICLCPYCGLRVAPYPDPEELPEEFYEGPPEEFYTGPPNCPHGNPWEACDACDYLGDLAYDASREKR